MTSDPRRPGRRAAILMWILGAIGLIFMGLFLLAGVVPVEEYPPETRDQLQRAASEAGVELSAFMRGLAIIGGLGMLVSVLTIVLAFFVWRSMRAAIGLTLVLTGLLIGFGVLGLLGALRGGTGAAVNVCVSGLYIAVLGLLFVWLMGAWRNAPLVRQYNLQSASGYAAGYLYGQQQAPYPPGGSGGYPPPTQQQYGASPPPPPPPPPPPRGQS